MHANTLSLVVTKANLHIKLQVRLKIHTTFCYYHPVKGYLMYDAFTDMWTLLQPATCIQKASRKGVKRIVQQNF